MSKSRNWLEMVTPQKIYCLRHPERETSAQIKNGIAHNLLTADYILQVGLTLVNIGEKRQKVRITAKITRFKSFYGVEPRTIKDAYHSFVDLSDEDDTSLKDFMMLVEWLKKCKSFCSSTNHSDFVSTLYTF